VNPYETGLDRNAANHVPLSPVGFLARAAAVHPDRVAIIHGAERTTHRAFHVYGLTETHGPDTVCAWQVAWDRLPIEDQPRLKARQGVAYPVQDGIMVADPATMYPVPANGATMGEVMHRGNVTMKGYLRHPKAAAEAFARDNMPRFMAPRAVVFGPLPKTATGKVQKIVLRARALDPHG
jgi:fatty-acyl-CoA synthase